MDKDVFSSFHEENAIPSFPILALGLYITARVLYQFVSAHQSSDSTRKQKTLTVSLHDYRPPRRLISGRCRDINELGLSEGSRTLHIVVSLTQFHRSQSSAVSRQLVIPFSKVNSCDR